ncbi:MAG: glycosyltransferase family 2 protein [Acholeplasma sp.]|nr:glycosyltransferase family 2 protein [Acholeplasma sp.]
MKNRAINIVCISFNTADETELFIGRAKKCSLIKHVFLVDNHSNEFNLAKIRNQKCDFVTIFENDRNYGFDYANNVGLRYVCETLREEWVCIANTDVLFDDEVINQLLDKMTNNTNLGVIAPSMINASDKSMVRSPRDFPTYKSLFRDNFYLLRKRFLKKKADNYIKVIQDDVEIVDAVSGGFMLFRAEALIECGYFDENIFMYFDEDALCWRLKKAGYLTGYYNVPTVIHDHDFSKKRYVDTTIISSRSARYFMKSYLKPFALKYYFYVVFNIYHIVEMKTFIFLKKVLQRKKK